MFGNVLDVEENVRPGLSRSVFVTFYEREAVARALNEIFFLFIYCFFIYLFNFYVAHRSYHHQRGGPQGSDHARTQHALLYCLKQQ